MRIKEYYNGGYYPGEKSPTECCICGNSQAVGGLCDDCLLLLEAIEEKKANDIMYFLYKQVQTDIMR